jgi:HD-GYP domain-containing protein (c-di-GMP phosphodiesterase class II)
VVDCFDALTSDRPYRAKLSDEEAVAILLARRGSMYDPLVVDAFLRIHREQLRPESVPLPHVRELGLKMLSAEPTIN